jgi:2-methylcitrate dehydratase PrpD
MRVRDHYRAGWHATTILGVVGAAAAVGRALGLDAKALRSALGLAVASVSGSTSSFGSWAKSLQVGDAASNAVRAALLARSGFSANETALESAQGLLAMFGDRERANRAVSELAKPSALLRHRPDLKPYPCCSAARAAIDAARQLAPVVQAVGLEEVSEIAATVEPGGLDALIHPVPTTPDEARFSMPILVAASLVDGCVDLQTFSSDLLERRDVRSLARRVVPCTSPTPPVALRWHDSYAVVRLTTRDGRDYVRAVSGPAGRPWTWRQVQEKLASCLHASRCSLDVDMLIASVRRLDPTDSHGRWEPPWRSA